MVFANMTSLDSEAELMFIRGMVFFDGVKVLGLGAVWGRG